MHLSVIIPTRNRANLLELALHSLICQTHPIEEYEIIIIDNGSTDHTRSVVQLYQKNLPNLIYAYEESPGLHVGRHAGLKISRGDILVYADDDIEALPTWLEGIAESFQDPDVALVGGNNLPKYEEAPPPWIEELWADTPYGKANGMYSILDFGDVMKEISPYYVWGCNFSIRKEILLQIGGFHPDGMPKQLLRYRGDGETAVSKEISKRGYKTIFNPKASVYHFVPKTRMTLDYIHWRGYIQGISDSYALIRKHRGISYSFLWRKYFSFVIYRIRSLVREGTGCQRSPHEIFKEGWWQGFFYHQREIKEDKELLKWILLENYFDEDSRIPSCSYSNR